MAVDLTAYRMDSILKKLRAIPLLSIFKFIRDIFAASVLVVAFIVIIWATVHYGEQNLDSDSPLCKPRTQVIGFIGDPDFYGLGIRLGLYLQWIAYLITAASLPQERRRVMISYVIFNLSITAAIMVKVFSRQCTFTTEFFVILTLFWGGIHVVQLPLMHASSLASLAKSFKESRTSNTHITRVISHTTEVSPSKACIPRTSRWLLWISQLFNFLISPITIWYWTRLAVVGQTDFAPTPGGSAFFFFGRISESGFKGLSIFMAIASAATYVQLVQAFLPLPCHLHEEPKLSDIFWIILYAITFPFSILMIFLRLVPMLFATAIARFYYKTHFEVDAVNEPDPTSPGILSPQEVFILIGTNLILSSIICLWCILAIELTLAWNTVSNVYSINNTGQILPFVSGACILLFTLWSCWKEHRRRQSKRKHDLEASVSGHNNVHYSNDLTEQNANAHDHAPTRLSVHISADEGGANRASTPSATSQESAAVS